MLYATVVPQPCDRIPADNKTAVFRSTLEAFKDIQKHH